MRRRSARLLLLLCCAALLLAGPARADGDPASDVLLGQDAYYPYAPNKVARDLQRALDGMLEQAKAKHFELKIAMIAAPVDLGAVPQLFTQPQKYADLLTSELAFNTKPRVLVVLPSGLGGNNLGDRAGAALTGITPEEAAGPDGLARAAMLAVGRLTAANGTPVPVPAVARGSGRASGRREGGGGASPLLIVGVPVALVLLAAGAAALRGRGQEDVDPDPDADTAGRDEAAQ
ncbi:MAG: hypothetical protein JWM31_3617 [Solirubrobacterales bacterium]|nr:hypothetical protein [Solirubrobacterales bacterium]